MGLLGGVECDGGEDGGGAAVVVVGVKLDARSNELLTWALVKVAQAGDRVIALHVVDPNADKSTLLSLVKTFDSLLAAYEGVCNLKQVDLNLKVCRGSPARKLLSGEAKSCGAKSVIIGTSKVRHTIRSRIFVAKYCAKTLPKTVSVTCVDNGKIVFQRASTASTGPGSLDALESRIKKRRTFSKSPLSLTPQSDIQSSNNGKESMSMALVPVKPQEIPESKYRWTLLRRVFLHGRRVSDVSSTKKSSVMQWLLKIPSRQTIASIHPDQKQISPSNGDDYCLGLDEEKGAIVPNLVDRNSDAYCNKMFVEELKDFREKYSTSCRLFSYEELLLATNKFTPENLIGKGGSSRVYRGCLPESREIAVKVLKPSEDVLKHFVSEIEIVTSLHHKNIISLVGFCIEDDRLLLVYNLLSRGCLEENLGTAKSGYLFGWEERYKVALGVAEALDCLHNTAEPIIHRDVKSSNILLSNDFEPQLSDFGLATWASSCSHHIDATDVAGTFGYLAPEYFMHGKLNEKIDVYAFGVVLLELLSGRKPIDNGNPKGQESLVMWAKHILKEGKISELQDSNIVNAYNQDQFERMVLAATLCIRRAPQSRPEIRDILKLLQGDPEVIEWAREETNSSEDTNAMNGEQSVTNIQSFINLALLNTEDDTTSVSSSEQNISVEDYLRGRWSRSASFDEK